MCFLYVVVRYVYLLKLMTQLDSSYYLIVREKSISCLSTITYLTIEQVDGVLKDKIAE